VLSACVDSCQHLAHRASYGLPTILSLEGDCEREVVRRIERDGVVLQFHGEVIATILSTIRRLRSSYPRHNLPLEEGCTVDVRRNHFVFTY
jgi:hypothetical protein